MLIYKAITRIKTYYKKYELKCQNKILIDSILIHGGKVGKDVKFGKNVMISGVSNIEIGNNVHIGTNGFIRANGGLTIGNNVFISRNVVLYTNSHNYKGTLLPFDNSNIDKPVIIENNVWIGMNVTIAPGTIIREGAIIGLGSRIFGEIPPRAIIGSSNFEILSYRDEKHYFDLKKQKKFCKEHGLKYEDNDGKSK